MVDKQPSKLFLIWSKSRGHYTLFRSLLTEAGWTVLIVQDLTNLSRLNVSETNLSCLAILSPTGHLSEDETEKVQEFISRGNSAIFASTSPTDQDDKDNASSSAILNKLSTLYGVRFNEDCVIRPNPYKLYHPHEVMIENFVVNRGLADVLRGQIEHKPSEDSLSKGSDGPIKFGPRILYANGCTMMVDIKLSTIVMTTSKWAIPSGQPIGAFYRSDTATQPRLVMLGSALLMSDQYLDKEDNRSLVNCFLNFVTNKNFPINISDARTIEIAKNNLTADMEKLAQNPIGCLRELEPLPDNKCDLIDTRLFSIDNKQLPKVMKAYKDLKVVYEPLTLMKPTFSWRATDQSVDEAPKFLLKRTKD